MKLEIVSEKPILGADLKEYLEAQKELNFRAQKTVEYLQQICSLDSKKAKNLIKKLEELNIPRLKDIHLYKIIDILPKSIDEVKLVVQGYNVIVSNENLKKIADTVSEFLSSKVA